MSQRLEAADSPDDFPTPPWATRALMEYVLRGSLAVSDMSCLEPACGAGHMSNVLADYFRFVESSDIHDYGFGRTIDFFEYKNTADQFDWLITNPPFRLAEEFVLKGLSITRIGVAILARTVFLESSGRYRAIFSVNPPTQFAQFVERVPMVRGRLDKSATTATGYCWLVWDKRILSSPELVWIPPCRKALERDGDYVNSTAKIAHREAFALA